MNLQEAIDKALLTWYAKDHPLHLELEHPAIKLAGEAGEILDLYGKHKYKPGFDWMTCKRCNGWGDCKKECVPKILDELGDLWYYLRILSYITEYNCEERVIEEISFDTLKILSMMSLVANTFQADIIFHNQFDARIICVVYTCLVDILHLLDYDLARLTELNYRKLNSEETNHGWQGA
jgi:hypothetical protein